MVNILCCLDQEAVLQFVVPNPCTTDLCVPVSFVVVIKAGH